MVSKVAPETERRRIPPLETSPRRSGGWFRELGRRVRLAFAGDNEALVLDNATTVSWKVYHDYHQLGIIDAGERQVFHIDKHGSLSARPCADDDVEYLVLSLHERVRKVKIYRRRIGKEVEVYDMGVA